MFVCVCVCVCWYEWFCLRVCLCALLIMKLIIQDSRGVLPPDKDIFRLANNLETPIKTIVKVNNGKVIRFADSGDAFKFKDGSGALSPNINISFTNEFFSDYTLAVNRTSYAWCGFEDREIKEALKRRYGGEIHDFYYDREKH